MPQPAEAQQSQAAVAAPQPLIAQPVDESHLTVLKGNTHRLARPEFDLGTAPATLPMQRMLLVLKRSPEQESSLRTLLDDQQDKSSPNYHKWLTPDQFGKQFGPTDADIQTITSWLQSHGFQVGSTKGRTVLEFSGSASQVREAFHTTIHKYIVNEEQHWANAGDPSIPAALTAAVAGVKTLHNFLKKPQIRMSTQKVAAKVRPGKSPALTFSDGTHALAPLDFATIYNSTAFNSAITGNGVTIGVIGRSNLYSVDFPAEDVSDFRSPTIFNVCCGAFNVVLNGPDPGDLGGGEEFEATLDSTWSGAVAPGATVDLVVSASTNTTDGIDLSEVYIIENNFADVMTESFSGCEAGGPTSTDAAGVSALAEQAAAQGITYFVSTGDSGAEGCDDPGSETVATGPVSVNLLAATPFNVAVGGTVFNDTANPALYWSSTNTSQESALSYIPEDVWNDSCLSSACGINANIAAGGGGASVFFVKPSWQSGVAGIVSDNARDIPDVSLSAAPHDGYVLCIDASCVPDATGGFRIALVGGTSASTPSFAGIMALVDQKMASLNPALGPRQGQANYVLYPLAAAQAEYPSQCNGSNTAATPNSACIFNDVTVGNNAVPGELNYGLANAQYQAGAGYDMATGLGSVNITNLVNAWANATFQPTITTLMLNGGTTPITITHGTAVNVAITVAPASGGAGTPAGDVALFAALGLTGQQTPVPLFAGAAGPQVFTLSGGLLTASTASLPGSIVQSGVPLPYNVTAHYAGTGTNGPASAFAPGDSNAVVVTVMPENSITTVSNFSQTGAIPNGTTLPFGTGVFVRADVTASSGQGIPTGTVTFADTFGNLPGPIFNPVTNPAALNSQGNTSIGAGVINFDAGNHSISATYGSDPSFNSSSSTTPVTFTIQPGFAGVSGPTDVTIASPGLSGTTTAGILTSTSFPTPITFTCVGLPAEAACVSTPLTGSGPNTIANATITVTTTAPHLTMLPRNQRPYYFALIFGGALPLAGIFLVVAPGRRRRRTLFGLMVVLAIVTVPGCGGGSGSSHHQDPGTPIGSYIVTVTATAGALSQQGTFTLTLQ
jgi:hypothetical protein